MRRSRCVPLPVRSALAGSALLLTAVLAAALPARADERKGSFEFGFYGGNTFYAKEQQLSNEIEKGLRIGWNFKPSFEVELESVLRFRNDFLCAETTRRLRPSHVRPRGTGRPLATR